MASSEYRIRLLVKCSTPVGHSASRVSHLCHITRFKKNKSIINLKRYIKLAFPSALSLVLGYHFNLSCLETAPDCVT